MVGKVIRDYIEGGAKKLTIPGFGTFMRRDGGEVIFVDLLRGDDHTLSEMVEDAGGYSELEAMALIDRFIFETKTAIERSGSASIEGFGTMTLDHKGVYQFVHSPKNRPVKEHAVQERLFEKEEPSRPSAKADGNTVGLKPSKMESRTSSGAERSFSSVKSVASAAPPGHAPQQRQGKPQQQRPPVRKPTRRPQVNKKSSRTDTIVIVAIVAAILAIAAMIYAFSVDNMPFLQP